jgi:hypothetical protein
MEEIYQQTEDRSRYLSNRYDILFINNTLKEPGEVDNSHQKNTNVKISDVLRFFGPYVSGNPDVRDSS